MTFRYLLIWAVLLTSVSLCQAQEEEEYIQNGTYFAIKGGLSINNQNWERQITTDLLFTPSFDMMAESYDSGSASRVYAQLGFHQRGSALGGFGFRRFASYKFNNVVLELGGRRMALDGEKWDGYYMLGLRGEYTLSTNLSETSNTSVFNLVIDDYVRKFNYGVTIGGGFEYDLGDYKQIFVEVVFSPDLSAQYDQPYEFTVINPFPVVGGSTENITISPQKVRNYSLELKVGYKWLY